MKEQPTVGLTRFLDRYLHFGSNVYHRSILFRQKTGIPLVLALVVGIILLSAPIYRYIGKNQAFQGVIEKVVYSVPKHIPTITVNSKDYYLNNIYYDRSWWGTVAVGDTVIKQAGTNEIIIKKRR